MQDNTKNCTDDQLASIPNEYDTTKDIKSIVDLSKGKMAKFCSKTFYFLIIILSSSYLHT